MTFPDIPDTYATYVDPDPEPEPRCTCWKPTAPEHQYDCPVAREERMRRRRSDDILALAFGSS